MTSTSSAKVLRPKFPDRREVIQLTPETVEVIKHHDHHRKKLMAQMVELRNCQLYGYELRDIKGLRYRCEGCGFQWTVDA